MFQIKYRCLYRDYWYDAPETNDWGSAVQTAQCIARQRGTAVVVTNAYTGEVLYSI